MRRDHGGHGHPDTRCWPEPPPAAGSRFPSSPTMRLPYARGRCTERTGSHRLEARPLHRVVAAARLRPDRRPQNPLPRRASPVRSRKPAEPNTPRLRRREPPGTCAPVPAGNSAPQRWSRCPTSGWRPSADEWQRFRPHMRPRGNTESLTGDLARCCHGEVDAIRLSNRQRGSTRPP